MQGETKVALRTFYLFASACAAALLSACATGDDLNARARASCEAQNIGAAEMPNCIDRTEATLRAAREHTIESRSPPPPPP